MGIHREGREVALNHLYQLDLGIESIDSVLDLVEKERRKSNRVKAFAKHIIEGVWANMEAVDELLSRHLDRWKLSRLNKTDRAILRMAVFEMKFDPDVPPKLALNEALDIGKKYGTVESGRFLNGVLDAVLHDLS